jgi:hypothetical protein
MIFFCEGGFTRGDAIFARGQVDAARAISMSPVKMDDKCHRYEEIGGNKLV